jgi:hypothetical protein
MTGWSGTRSWPPEMVIFPAGGAVELDMGRQFNPRPGPRERGT